MVKKERIEPKVAISRRKIGGEVPIVVNMVTDKCLYSGFLGTLDSARMQLITNKILDLIQASSVDVILIDLANIDILDSAVAAHLESLGKTLRFSGCEVIFCGVTPIIAQTMVTAGINVGQFKISRDLKSALKEVFALQGLELVPIKKEK